MEAGDLNQLLTMNQDGNIIHNVIVKGKLIVQVVSYRDISVSLNTIQKRISNKKKIENSNSNGSLIVSSNSSSNRSLSGVNGDQGEEDNEEEEDDDNGEFEFDGDKNSKMKGKKQRNRMYKVWLSDDGQRQVIGLEYTRMACFDAIRIGARYEITNAIMKRGMLILTDMNTKLLGYYMHPPMKPSSAIDTFAENTNSSSSTHPYSLFQTPTQTQQNQSQQQQQISKQSDTTITPSTKPAAKSSQPATVEIIDDDDFDQILNFLLPHSIEAQDADTYSQCKH